MNQINKNPDTLGLPAPIAVLGLGYVGLPLALAFGQHLPTFAFDVDAERVDDLRSGCDRHAVHDSDALQPPHLTYTSNPEDLAAAEALLSALEAPDRG